MAGGSLSWQAGRRRDCGVPFRQCGLASFVGCSNSASILAMEPLHRTTGLSWRGLWCSSRPFCPAYRKLRKNLICFAFCFPILWKWGLSLLFLLDSMENLHEGVCVFSPFPTHITLPAPSASPLDVISQSQLGARLPEGSRQGLQGHQDWQNCSTSPHDLEMKAGRKPPCVRTARSWEHLSGLLNASRESLSCTNCFNRAIFTMLLYLLSHWNYKIVTVPENWEP